ncbi:hypothetical protein GGI43DRAFT_79192 [Trichoderma evansii]
METPTPPTTPTPKRSVKAISPRSKIPVKTSLKLQKVQHTTNYNQITTYFKIPEKLPRAPTLKGLDVTRLPDDLKLIGPENWATWSSIMMAIADVSGFDKAALEEVPQEVHVSCWHNSQKTMDEIREGKMLGLLIKFNISAHMNDLVSLTADGYEVWKVLKLYCAREIIGKGMDITEIVYDNITALATTIVAE